MKVMKAEVNLIRSYKYRATWSLSKGRDVQGRRVLTPSLSGQGKNNQLKGITVAGGSTFNKLLQHYMPTSSFSPTDEEREEIANKNCGSGDAETQPTILIVALCIHMKKGKGR